MAQFLALPKKRFHPRRYRPRNVSAWAGHLPFAKDLVSALRPSILVELGTHLGESYFGFCQAVEEDAIDCLCYAVDTWKGDPHSGFYDESVFEETRSYNDRNYAHFSSLLRSTFDDACPQFARNSIDLLHIDGLHTYEAVRHDFDNWFPKVRPGGIVLFHDIVARRAGFEVWRFWEELKTGHRCFEFHQWFGLGVLQKEGAQTNEPELFRILFSSSEEDRQAVRDQYALAAENLSYSFLAPEEPARAAFKPVLQVYAGRYGGYAEEESVLAEIEPEERRSYCLLLKDGPGLAPMRVDPSNCPCIVDLEEINVRRAADGQLILQMTDWKELANLQCEGDLLRLEQGAIPRFFSYGADPNWIVPPQAGNHATTPSIVEIRMRVSLDLTPAGDMMRRLCERQKADAAEFQREIADLSERLHREIDVLKADLSSQRRLRCEQELELDGLRRRIDQCDADIVSQLKTSGREKIGIETQVRREYTSSYSWRVTAPLRAAVRLLKSKR